MPVDDPHMANPGVQGGKVVLRSPGSVGFGDRILGPELSNGNLRAFLGIWEQPCGKIKSNRRENKLAREESL
jgi:hypothetical protein